MVSIVLDSTNVGTFSSINALGNSDNVDVDVTALFPAGSEIEIVFDDDDFDADGNLITDDDVFIDIIITESNGSVITISEIKLDLAPERIGDTYFSTADAVTFTDSNGNFFDSQIIAVTSEELRVGQMVVIRGDQNPDSDSVFNICFEGSALIETSRGRVAARDLVIGDLVRVQSGAFKPIKFIARARTSVNVNKTKRLPVLIKAGALGTEQPSQDLIVSGQHRILVGCSGQIETSGLPEGLVAAKALTVLPGIRKMRGKPELEWVNFAFETHEIVCSNGAWLESLLLGPEAVKSLTPDEQAKLNVIFPQTHKGAPYLNGPPAHKLLKVQKVAESLRNAKQIEDISV